MLKCPECGKELTRDNLEIDFDPTGLTIMIDLRCTCGMHRAWDLMTDEVLEE